MKTLLVLVATALASTAATAANPSLEQVIVTATRTAQGVDDVLASVSTFDRADIEALQARSVEDLLRGTEGLTIANSGGPGKVTSFFVRGTESDHVLVLLDGIKLGSATSGAVSLQSLPIEQIERIEFVRGPRASLYGTEAVGGVIQLFTYRAHGTPKVSFSAGGGSFATESADAAVSGGNEQAWFNARGSWQNIQGFDACRGSSSLFAGCFTEEPDKDGYRYHSGALSGGLRFGNGTEIEASWLRSDGTVRYDGSFANEDQVVQQAFGAKLHAPLGDHWTLSANVGRAEDFADSFGNGVFAGRFNTVRDSASLQADWRASERHALTLGYDYLKDAVTSDTPYDVSARDNKGVFTQYIAKFGALRLEASARHDNNQQFGGHETASVALGYQFSPLLEVIAQHGTAFKAPSFNELYYPGFSNPLLVPERSRSSEISARGRVGALRWRLAGYENRINDLIGFDSNFSVVNIDLARIRGVEAKLDLPLGNWNLSTALSQLNPANETPGTDFGKLLPRRPKSSARLDVDRRFRNFSIGGTMVAEGERFDNSSNRRRVGGYATVDLRAEWRVNDAWRVQARVANLLDRKYETVAFYNQAGRAAYLTLRFAGGGR